ncbi:MAG: hypothetical protein WCC17_02765, partial [Candidatus Nitrosopolaris sp.]
LSNALTSVEERISILIWESSMVTGVGESRSWLSLTKIGRQTWWYSIIVGAIIIASVIYLLEVGHP